MGAHSLDRLAKLVVLRDLDDSSGAFAGLGF
ncbi:MAG: hypothetical protein ACJA1E_000511 [Paracoccaceae bacterium]|jgi:hypothetical protein